MATFTWKTAASGAFETAADWTPSGPPGAAADALLTVAGGAYTVTTGASDTVNSLQTAANATLSIGAALNFTMSYGTESTAFPTGANAGQILVGNGGDLFLGGVFNNISTVAGGGLVINGGASTTELRILGASASLTGGGNVVLGGTTGNDYIVGNNGANSVLVNVNNTISGEGNIGNGSLSLTNQTAGVIDANQTSALTLQVNGGVVNTGTLEASAAGGLVIYDTGIDNEGNGNAGEIVASVSGAHVDLTQSAAIYGGTLSAVSGAQIDVVAGQTAYLVGQDPGAPVNITAGSNFNIDNDATLDVYGTLDNQGLINLDGGAGDTEFRIATPVVTLTGGGQLNLVSGPAYIFGAGGGADELDNLNNTISGEGDIGNGEMTLKNETLGVIDANQATALELNPNDGTTNIGLLEATGTGGLLIAGGSVDNTLSNGTVVDSGQIKATGAGAHVDLQGSVGIYGGVITTASGGFVDVVAGQAAYFYGNYVDAPVVIASGSNVDVNNDAELFLDGTIFNSGTIDLGVPAEANDTELRLASSIVTLTTATPTLAGGVVQMSNSANNYIFASNGAAQTLNDVNNTIQGSGDIGNGDMTLIVGKKGVIDANQAPNGTGQPGVLELNPSGGVMNSGLIESNVATGQTVGGTLFIAGTTINNGAAGRIEAAGIKVGTKTYGSVVELQNATIIGGTLEQTASNPSTFQVNTGQNTWFNGVSVKLTDDANVNVDNGANLILQGAIVITKGRGAIDVLAGANVTYLSIGSATVTLSGAGTITLGGSGNNYIASNNGDQALINTNVTIQGTGNIGNGGALEFYNSGTIDANAATTLTINEGPAVENNGVLEATTGGQLLILDSNIDNTYGTTLGMLNTGKITASGASAVNLQNSNIYGGTLTTTGAAVIDVVAGQTAGLNGSVEGQAVNIAAGSNIDVNNGADLYLYGAIDNAGVITDEGGANATYIYLDSPLVTLSGGGDLVLGGTGDNYITQAQANCELDNVSDIISGAGDIGNGGAMSLTNAASGTIDALTGGITINLGGVELINAGTLEATAGALVVSYGIFNTGTIIADGGSVTLGGNVNGAGAIELFGSSNVEISASHGGAADQLVTFEAGATGIFKIDNAQEFTGVISGFGPHGTLDLANVAFATASYAYNATTGVLTVTDGTIVANLNLAAGGVGADFTLANDGSGHTDVTYSGPTPLVAKRPTDGVARMAAAMASLGGGSPASTSSLPSTSHAVSTLIALPHSG